MMGYGFDGFNNMMGWGFGPFGWIFMIFWWVLIVVGIVAFVRLISGTGQSRGDRDHHDLKNYEKTARPAGGSALEILKERYAKGEIDKKEFEEKKKDLS